MFVCQTPEKKQILLPSASPKALLFIQAGRSNCWRLCLHSAVWIMILQVIRFCHISCLHWHKRSAKTKINLKYVLCWTSSSENIAAPPMFCYLVYPRRLFVFMIVWLFSVPALKVSFSPIYLSLDTKIIACGGFVLTLPTLLCIYFSGSGLSVLKGLPYRFGQK